jgi:hypothetical protein
LLKIWNEYVIKFIILYIFSILNNVYDICWTGAVEAGAAARYGSGSFRLMRLQLRKTDFTSKHCIKFIYK